MQDKINIIALVAGLSTLVLIAISIFVPWWSLRVGTPAIASIEVSPVNLNLALMGNSLTFPLILALNIASAITLAAGGIIMVIYGLKPNKHYSKKLLGFGYKKPLYAVILFVAALMAMFFLVPHFSGFTIPLTGSSILSFPQGMAPDGVSISVNVSAGFGWPFYFAIVVAGLCVAARVYHKKLAEMDTALPPPPPPPSQ
jgi:hypothetical protein